MGKVDFAPRDGTSLGRCSGQEPVPNHVRAGLRNVLSRVGGAVIPRRDELRAPVRLTLVSVRRSGVNADNVVADFESPTGSPSVDHLLQLRNPRVAALPKIAGIIN